MASGSSAVMADHELAVTRLIRAQRDAVFRAWTDPARVGEWWGPEGFVTTYSEMDIRPGGVFRQGMRSPTGSIHRKRGVYREIVAPERIVFTFAWEEEDGSLGPETLITVTLEAIGENTLLTLHQNGFVEVETRDGHIRGWTSCLARFAAYMEAGA